MHDRSLRTRLRESLYKNPRRFDQLKAGYRLLRKSDIYRFFAANAFGANRPPTFLQIGANDGLRNDPIREFVASHGWQGIFVEPLPFAFQLLQNNYAYLGARDLRFVNAGISDRDTSMQLWTYTDSFLATLPADEQLFLLRKSSFDRELVTPWVASHPDSDSLVTAVEVPVLSLPTLLQQHGQGLQVDILVVDAEGHESVILPSIDFDTFRPRVIYFESHNLGPERDRILELLVSAGYRLNHFDVDTAAWLPPDHPTPTTEATP